MQSRQDVVADIEQRFNSLHSDLRKEFIPLYSQAYLPPSKTAAMKRHSQLAVIFSLFQKKFIELKRYAENQGISTMALRQMRKSCGQVNVEIMNELGLCKRYALQKSEI